MIELIIHFFRQKSLWPKVNKLPKMSELFVSKVRHSLKQLFRFVWSWGTSRRICAIATSQSRLSHWFCFTFFKEAVKTFVTPNSSKRRVWKPLSGSLAHFSQTTARLCRLSSPWSSALGAGMSYQSPRSPSSEPRWAAYARLERGGLWCPTGTLRGHEFFSAGSVGLRGLVQV